MTKLASSKGGGKASARDEAAARFDAAFDALVAALDPLGLEPEERAAIETVMRGAVNVANFAALGLREHSASPVAFPTRLRRLQSAAKDFAKPLPGERRIKGTVKDGVFTAERTAEGRTVPVPRNADRTGDMLLALQGVRLVIDRPELGDAEIVRAHLAGAHAEFATLTNAQIAEAFKGAKLDGGRGRGKRGPVGVLVMLAKAVGLASWTKKAIENADRGER